ncbi:MAG: T9SS type A sorting domain-containing protein, partial [Ignavibacteria bacterium]|nr:T9SS type A sorting domain-containing protein [Ignavibacteria bacterium]
IDGVGARDWEDMAIGPGPDSGEQYLYIGEIGDNNALFEIKYIYRVPEPDVDSSQTPIDTTLYGAEVITFKYPDGSRDAETVMVDPITKDIYIVSKRENNVRVYLAPYPQSTTDTITLEHKATLDSTQITGGDISQSGLEILIKTYYSIFYWHREPGQELWEALANPPLIIPYIQESQGEAVGWEPEELGGYYTTSEERDSIPAHLYFYPRLDSTVFVVDDSELPVVHSLFQNFPNPFNPATTVKYQIPEFSFVTLKVYDVLGSEIVTLVNNGKPAGSYEVEFNATTLPSGVYFYRLQSGSFVETKKMILLK